MKQKRYFLEENEIPRQWYNIQADMPVKPMPMLNPNTKEPVTVEDLSELFCEECSRQELNTVDRWIDIPEEVLERYAYYRSTPLVRAYSLEEALGTLDVLYMTRIQQERFASREEYLRLKDSYVLTAEKLASAKSDLSILHPLPRVNEISVAIDNDPRACYFKQVKNAKFMRMALMLKLLGV
jgi:hypothetical protein